MKRLITLIFLFFIGFITLQSFHNAGFGKKDGTEPGYTGSPGDSLKNCTACHGGTPVAMDGWITSTVPATGYVPGQTYTITATNTEFGGNRFGFELSPQNIQGDLLGTMIVTDTARTKLVGNDKYITYREAGVEAQDSNSWTFDWIAPPAGTKDVIFYGAFNSNFNGHKDGDHTYLSVLILKEAGTVSVPVIKEAGQFRVYPNPASGYMNLDLDVPEESDVKAELTDMSGKTVLEIMNGRQQGSLHKRINVSGLSKGTYLLRVISNGKAQSQKVQVIH